MQRIRIFLFLITFFSISACNSNIKIDAENLSPFNYFFGLNYNLLDTLVNENVDTTFVFYFITEHPNEKIYLKKDTIEHNFGTLAENGTFWVYEWLYYNKFGEIFDESSNFVFLNISEDSAKYSFIASDKKSFRIKIYNPEPDTSRGELIKTFNVTGTTKTISNKDLMGRLIVAEFSEDIHVDSINKKTITIEVPISRLQSKNSLSHLKLIKDKRIKQLLTAPTHKLKLLVRKKE